LFNQPKALILHNSGLLFIADTGNAAIRVINQYSDFGYTLTLPLTDDPSVPFLSLPVHRRFGAIADRASVAGSARRPGRTRPGEQAGGIRRRRSNQ